MGPRPGSGRLPPLSTVDTSTKVLKNSLVSAAPPPLDFSKLQDVLLHQESQINYLLQLFEPENFDLRVNKLIDGKVVPALNKRDEEFVVFSERIFGDRKECVVQRILKSEVDIGVTKDALASEERQRKDVQGKQGARILRNEASCSEKADQTEVDALLRSVITTMGNVGQRMGENEAGLGVTKVAQEQLSSQIVLIQQEIADLAARLAVDVKVILTRPCIFLWNIAQGIYRAV